MKWYWSKARRLAEENGAKIQYLAETVGQINTILGALAKLIESQQKSLESQQKSLESQQKSLESQQKSLDLYLGWQESVEAKSSKIPPGLIMLPPMVAGFLGPAAD